MDVLGRMDVAKMFIYAIRLAMTKSPSNRCGLEGDFIAIIFAKSTSHISCIIAINWGDYEELHIWICPRQHRSPKSG